MQLLKPTPYIQWVEDFNSPKEAEEYIKDGAKPIFGYCCLIVKIPAIAGSSEYEFVKCIHI